LHSIFQGCESKVTWAADFEYASYEEEKPHVKRELARKTQTVADRRKNCWDAHPKSKKGDVVARSHGRNYRSCEPMKLTRSESGTHVSGRADEKRGRNC
jgi:hypothetical protein